MASFVKLSVQETFDNIQYFRNSDGSICGSSKIGFGTEQNVNQAEENTSFSSLLEVFRDNFAKSFSKSSQQNDDATAQAKYIIESLDKDKSGTISINELSNVDKSDLNTNLDKQISNLENQFKIYDINQDGELNVDEIKNALGQKRYSTQDLAKMSKDFHENKLASKDDKPIIQASDIM